MRFLELEDDKMYVKKHATGKCWVSWADQTRVITAMRTEFEEVKKQKAKIKKWKWAYRASYEHIYVSDAFYTEEEAKANLDVVQKIDSTEKEFEE